MNSLKGIAKGGWHPKHDVDLKKPSARGDFKGISQMVGQSLLQIFPTTFC